MNRSFRIYYWGMLISFLGSLPPGVTNIIGMQISSNKGIIEAVLYISGFVLAEAIVVRFALMAMDRLTQNKIFFHVLEWTTAGMLIIFSIVCFFTTDSLQNSTILPGALRSSFISGMVISFINPMHIPFWLGWSTVLMNRGILRNSPAQYNIYIAGIGSGTVAGFFGFLLSEHYLLKTFQSNQYLINCIVGLTLLAAAFLQLRKMIVVPAAVRHAKLFRR